MHRGSDLASDKEEQANMAQISRMTLEEVMKFTKFWVYKFPKSNAMMEFQLQTMLLGRP